MKIFKTALFLIILFAPFLFPPSSIYAQSESEDSSRIIIRYKENISSSEKEVIKRKSNGRLEKTLTNVNSDVFEVDKSKIDETITKLQEEKEIEYVEKDYKAYALTNDPYYSEQWSLPQTQTPLAWNITKGSSSIKVAIIDTGINGAHPDLIGKIDGRANFTTEGDFDGNGHGTHVAGIAAASTDNNIGIAGIAPDVRLLSVKVLDTSGTGFYSEIASGVIWAADNGAKVINLSLGGSFNSKTLENAINYAWNKGVLIVAAAGNSGNKRPVYPAYYNNVIAVAATNQDDNKANFSTYGTWVDVAAPGVSIISSYHNSYASLSGTSMSSPMVAGLGALIFSKNPNFSPQQVRNKIESSSDRIARTGSYWLHGRINACRALDCTTAPVILPSPSPSLSPSPSSTRRKPSFCRLRPTHRLCL